MLAFDLQGNITRACAQIQHHAPLSQLKMPDQFLPPADILANRHQAVQQVVAVGDAPKHLLDIGCPVFTL